MHNKELTQLKMKNPLIRPQDISNKYNEVIARNSPEADDEAIPKNKIPSGVYPEQKDKILRSAQNDKRRTRSNIEVMFR
jgi:hypothetical protein